MALIKCYECDKQISDRADICPKCGAPVRGEKQNKGETAPYTDQEVAVMLSKKINTNHALHLILSLVTAGIWILVWYCVYVANYTANSNIDKNIQKGKEI
jgi:uncharacterized membrane protein YvbJ